MKLKLRSRLIIMFSFALFKQFCQELIILFFKIMTNFNSYYKFLYFCDCQFLHVLKQGIKAQLCGWLLILSVLLWCLQEIVFYSCFFPYNLNASKFKFFVTTENDYGMFTPLYITCCTSISSFLLILKLSGSVSTPISEADIDP